MSEEATIEDVDDDTEEVVNISSMPATFTVDNMRVKLPPGKSVRIHKNYARRQKMAKDRDPVQSPIELLTGGRVVPSSDPRNPNRQKTQQST